MDTVKECSVEVGHDFFDHMFGTVESGFPGEVVMVVPRTDGRVLLMIKAFYPKGAYRLPTGKLNDNEDPEEALHRELYEETGFRSEIDQHLGKLDYILRCGELRVPFHSYIYLVQPTDEAPQTLDDEEQITGFLCVPAQDLHVVADQLRKLGQQWADWGRFRAIAHDFVAEAMAWPYGLTPHT